MSTIFGLSYLENASRTALMQKSVVRVLKKRQDVTTQVLGTRYAHSEVWTNFPTEAD